MSKADQRPQLRVLFIPLAFSALLAAFAALPSSRDNERLLWSYFATAGLLAAWTAALFVKARAQGRSLRTHFVLRRPHWLQPIVQGSVYLYWGWHWPQVFQSLHFIAAQLVFAYAFDTLLAWSRGQDDYELGFGAFPIIFSINLFLWFKPDWFWLQFVLVAAGFAAKQLLRWTKDGRSAHIFNPSSFPLAVASVLLIATGTVDHTWGREIALTLEQPRYIYQFLFLISVPGQLLFGVATMTMPAVITAFLLGAAYTAITGTYYFFGAVPVAAFLGMLLLFTDPSTAPRTELGRVLYGVIYGASVFVLYGLLETFGQTTFYDKLLFVPVLNLSVRALDRLAEQPWLARLDPARLAKGLAGRPRYAAFTSIWALVFVGLVAVDGVGDHHPATRLPFWQRACDQNLRNGCRNLETMESRFCADGAAWACNELGLRKAARREPVAAEVLDRGCGLGSRAACANLQLARGGMTPVHRERPGPRDFNVMLDNKGLPTDRTSIQLVQWACTQGWAEACVSSDGDPTGAPAELQRKCAAGDRGACRSFAVLLRRGEGVARDDQRAMACELGLVEICAGVAQAGFAPAAR